MIIRGSIGNAISGTTIAGNRVIQAIGSANGTDLFTMSNVVSVKAIHIYQRGTTALSFNVVRTQNDQSHSAEVAAGRWTNYGNNITQQLLNPALITFSANPSVQSPALASAILGPNQGDYMHLSFEHSIDTLIRDISGGSLYQCIGLQLVDIATYDLDVTWIYEFNRGF